MFVSSSAPCKGDFFNCDKLPNKNWDGNCFYTLNRFTDVPLMCWIFVSAVMQDPCKTRPPGMITWLWDMMKYEHIGICVSRKAKWLQHRYLHKIDLEFAFYNFCAIVSKSIYVSRSLSWFANALRTNISQTDFTRHNFLEVVIGQRNDSKKMVLMSWCPATWDTLQGRITYPHIVNGL